MHKNNDPLPGVKCVVNTCHYNVDGQRCNASSIEIEPKNARDSDDTDCSTFRPGQGLK